MIKVSRSSALKRCVNLKEQIYKERETKGNEYYADFQLRFIKMVEAGIKKDKYNSDGSIHLSFFESELLWPTFKGE